LKHPDVEIFHHVAFRQLELLISMSALGQKPTYALQKAMSALPPGATVKADMPQW
jgi:hypothetical protein